MSPLSCPDVESRLDLYAADECDAPETEAIRRHLAGCPRCAAACDEARQFLGLLDLRLQEPERLRRLEDRLAAEAEPRRRVLRFPATLRRVAALAALLLLTVGPVGWLTPGLQLAEGSGLALALHEPPARGGLEAMAFPGDVRGAKKDSGRVHRVQVPGLQAVDHQPPEVELTLELRNTTDRPMRVWVAGPPTELRLDLRGPGAVAVPVTDGDEAKAQAVTLRPGEEHIIPVNGLTGSRRSWYWTKPGDYTLTAQFTTRATTPGIGERRLVVRSEPMTFHVEGK
jgi:hypothetical protein